MKPSRRRGWRFITGIAAVLLAIVVAGAMLAHGTVTPLSGTQAISGLSKPVDIIRDNNAVPHIYARSVADAYRGLGYAHAQDRLWQMETTRRAAQGRLSEMLGPRTLETDIFLRTLDLYGHAERAVEHLTPTAQRLLEAYADGVNAFITRETSPLETRLPPEFLLLRHKPEPWRPADSIAVVKMMALNLSANLNAEISRLTLAAQGLSPEEILDVMPPADGSRPPALPDIAQLYPLQRVASAPAAEQTAALDTLIGGGASNSWVIGGAHTRSGAPLLANDPHLRLSAPSIWYLAHLATDDPVDGPANMLGASLPGTPLIVLGRGDTLAWGFTNSEADVQDLFIERVNPDNPNEYLTPQGWRAFETEDMVIRVKGQNVRIVPRRRTRHGPVLPSNYRNLGQILGPRYVAALQWAALTDDDTTIAAGLFDANVRDVQSYMARARAYVVPMQAVVVADTKGQIAMFAPGRVPIRHPLNRIAGRAPVPGWDPTYDWQGYIPFDELPRNVDPPQGAIGTANARIVGDNYPNFLTYDWDPGYRLRRLNDLIIPQTGHDVDSMRAGQMDVLSPAFAELAPLMVAAARRSPNADTAVLDQLSRWDASMHADAAEPLIFMAWLRAAVPAIFEDDLGASFPSFFNSRAPTMIRLLRGQATSRDWCDDRKTEARESCSNVLAAALRTALADLEKRFGTDRAQWSWGAAHVAFGEHQVLGQLAVIGPLFNIGRASPGGPYTLNRGVTEFSAAQPYANRHASSYRAIYDLADLDRSIFIQPTGQSGNPFSPYYRTFEKSWSAGEYIHLSRRREDVTKQAIGTWRLTPAPGAGN